MNEPQTTDTGIKIAEVIIQATKRLMLFLPGLAIAFMKRIIAVSTELSHSCEHLGNR